MPSKATGRRNAIRTIAIASIVLCAGLHCAKAAPKIDINGVSVGVPLGVAEAAAGGSSNCDNARQAVANIVIKDTLICQKTDAELYILTTTKFLPAALVKAVQYDFCTTDDRNTILRAIKSEYDVPTWSGTRGFKYGNQYSLSFDLPDHAVLRCNNTPGIAWELTITDDELSTQDAAHMPKLPNPFAK